MPSPAKASSLASLAAHPACSDAGRRWARQHLTKTQRLWGRAPLHFWSGELKEKPSSKGIEKRGTCLGGFGKKETCRYLAGKLIQKAKGARPAKVRPKKKTRSSKPERRSAGVQARKSQLSTHLSGASLMTYRYTSVYIYIHIHIGTWVSLFVCEASQACHRYFQLWTNGPELLLKCPKCCLIENPLFKLHLLAKAIPTNSRGACLGWKPLKPSPKDAKSPRVGKQVLDSNWAKLMQTLRAITCLLYDKDHPTITTMVSEENPFPPPQKKKENDQEGGENKQSRVAPQLRPGLVESAGRNPFGRSFPSLGDSTPVGGELRQTKV